jgi:hypothetical protein
MNVVLYKKPECTAIPEAEAVTLRTEHVLSRFFFSSWSSMKSVGAWHATNLHCNRKHSYLFDKASIILLL